MTAPAWKDPAPWGYVPTGPFFYFEIGNQRDEDTPYDNFIEPLERFVRERMMPSQFDLGAVITDNDGVVVIGWSWALGYLQYLGIEWGWSYMDNFTCLNPLKMQAARMQILSDRDVAVL